MGLSVNIPVLEPLPLSTIVELMHVNPETEEIVPATKWALTCVNPAGCPKFSWEEDLSQWEPVYIPQPPYFPYPATCYVWPYNPVACPAGVEDEYCGRFVRCSNIATFSTVVGIVPEEIALSIDIMPGSDINPINFKSKGILPVAILGRSHIDFADADNIVGVDDFDIIDMINPETLNFHGASPSHDLSNPQTFADHRQDVNGDGFMDLVIHFRVQDIIGLDTSSIEGCLEGSTESGQSFRACDSIRCK